MNRTRHKTNDYVTAPVGPCHQKWYSPNSSTLYNEYDLPLQGPIVVSEDIETMQDSTGKSKPVRTVIHSRRALTRNSYAVDTYGSGSSTFVTTGPNAHWQAWGHYGEISHRHVSTQWLKSDNLMILEAVKAFFDVNEVDNLLNAVESPELVTSIRPLFNRVNAVRVIRNGLTRRQIIQYLKANARNLTGVLSGGYLYYVFGVAPIIGDMRKCSLALASLKSQIENALKKSGKVESIHRAYSGTATINYVAQFDPAGYGQIGEPNTYWHSLLKPSDEEGVSGAPRKVVTVRGIRRRKFETKLFAKLDYLIRRFGSSGPATYYWERIPFSFVVDWFIDVSAALKSIDNLLTGGAQSIQDVCLSERWKFDCPIIKHQIGTTVSSYDGVQTANVKLSYYHRKPVNWSVLPIIRSRFGKKQGLITAALIAQMGANLKVKKR